MESDNHLNTAEDAECVAKRRSSLVTDFWVPPRGTKINGLIIGPTLGMGSFGIVKKVYKDDEEFAVKFVSKKNITCIDEIENVYHETAILTSIKHRHVIQFVEVIDTPENVMLVMEFAQGGELQEYIKKSSPRLLPEAEACRIFEEILDGLEYLHRRKIIHRDLKLENVLMHHNEVKIADFGLSDTIKFGQKNTSRAGTPLYLSPEQILGPDSEEGVSAASDVWALGVILFKIVTSFFPFNGSTTKALYPAISQGRFVAPHYISQPCTKLIKRMLTVAVAKRITIREIRTHPWMLTPDHPQESSVTQEEVNEAEMSCERVNRARRVSKLRPKSLSPLRKPRRNSRFMTPQNPAKKKGVSTPNLRKLEFSPPRKKLEMQTVNHDPWDYVQDHMISQIRGIHID